MMAASFSTPLFASLVGQAPEYLIYNGRKYDLYNDLLYEYLKKYPEKRPKSPVRDVDLSEIKKHDELLYEYLKKYPEKRPKSPVDLRRGYIATYEIKNNELLLKDIGIRVDKGRFEESVLESVLAEFLVDKQSALKIDWFSGFLFVPEGDRRRKGTCVPFDMHGGSTGSNYENYILIEIKNGNFVKEIRMNCLECQQFMYHRTIKQFFQDVTSKQYGEARNNWYHKIDELYEHGGESTAGEQYPEYLIYNAKKYFLYNEPLYEYFKKHPERRPKSNVLSHNLIRGYIAEFEIKNNELFLKDIGFHLDNTEYGKPVLKSVLPKFLTGQSTLKIDWFSGFLVIPDGDIKRRYERKYAPCVVSRMMLGGEVTSYYDNYILIEIKNGNFVSETRMNCPEYRQFRNIVFKENYDDYENIDELSKWCKKKGGCASRKLK